LPEKDLPRAIIAALVISTLLYVLVAIAAVSVLGWQDLAQSPAPAAEVASAALGLAGDRLITVVSLAATGSTGLFLLMAASRSVWAMSCAGVFPLPFCTIGRRQTPWIAILGVGVVAGVFIAFKDITTIAQFTNIAVLAAFIAVNAAAIKLTARNFRDRLVPGLGLVSSASLALGTERHRHYLRRSIRRGGTNILSGGKTQTDRWQIAAIYYVC